MKNLLIISLFFFICSCKVENLPPKVKGNGVFYGNVVLVNGITNAPSFVDVIVKASNENYAFMDTTNESGNFSISKLPRGTYDITYSKIGYYNQITRGIQTSGKDSVPIKLYWSVDNSISQFLCKKFNIYLDEFEIAESNDLVTITSLKFHAANEDTNSVYIYPTFELCSKSSFDYKSEKVFTDNGLTLNYYFRGKLIKHNDKLMYTNILVNGFKFPIVDIKTGDTIFLRPIINDLHQKNNIVKYFIKK